MNHDSNCICEPCIDKRVRQIEREREAGEVAQTVTRFLNHANPKDLALAIASDHRTLQSLFMRVAIEYIEHYAKLPEGMYDGRNAAAVKFAQAVTSTEEWKVTGRIPYI